MFQSPTDLKFPVIINFWRNKPAALLAWAFLLSLFCLPGSGIAQNRNALEATRKKLIREIELTDKMLKKTTRSKEAALDRYIALQKQIERREKLINTLEAEIEASQRNIERTATVIESLNRDIQLMRADYAKMVRNAFRRKTLSNPLLYILSAQNLNQAFRRWLFLRKYDRYRKTQAEAIVATQRTLNKKIKAIETSRANQEALLQNMQNQQAVLSSERDDKEKLLDTLKKDESRLRSDLEQKQAAHEALNQAIERVIQGEINKKIRESRQTQTQPTTPQAASPEPANPKPDETETGSSTSIPDDSQTQSFRQNQGRLPWPVDDGIITRRYGRQKHPTLKNIEITNNGIDIRTAESAAVRAVFAGKVAGVQFIPGHDYTIILQHGNYYTVYSNLGETSIEKGDQVAARQQIGRVNSNPVTGASELHFELWYQKQRLNPASWLKK